MKEFKLPEFLKDDNYLFLVILFIFSVIFVLNKLYTIALLSIITIIIILVATLGKHNRRQKNLKNYVIDFTNNLENLSVSSIFNFPMPALIIDDEGKVCWYNLKFREVILDMDNFEKLEDIAPSFSIKSLQDNNQGVLNNLEIIINSDQKCYNVLYSKLSEGQFSDNAEYILYWVDNTSFKTLKNKYNDERPIAMIIQIDNFDEMSEKMDKLIRASMVAEIEKILNKYATEMNGFVLKYNAYRFLMVIENQFLESLENKKFSLLEEVKEIKSSGEFYYTLSIGVGAYAKTIGQLLECSKGALDIALGRGGDQAVVKKINSVKFYGGKSKAVEKRTKVKARVISFALRQIIDQSSNVIIMGHKIGDMDSLGSSIGLYSIAKSRGKKAYIVLNNVNYALKNLCERMEKEDASYIEALVTTEQAIKLIDSETVCVVLDTSKGSFTEAPEVLEEVDKVVLIDHHRRSEEYIENAVLDYIEPYASSTCELVSELIQYMDDHIKITKFEADALLAGIVVDTNSFIFKTGVRTFEAASFLRRNGADTIEVKDLFSESLDVMKKKTEIVDRAEMKFGDVAISYIDDEEEENNVMAAKAADELLTVRNVKASFVLVKHVDYIHISGRSMGQISVQLILELLGGGGHLTMAGAQVKTSSINEAKEKLYEAIKQYKEDGKEE
ncbi:DHH family phosphoesterase [Sedimentibacter sp. zth1]|uniref:DHH family phosphoesterase n=1 Tax=Sedimentibacter sp. zth1 TaxID=2816908 RepID=UPI001A916BCD|nr:DHH family phosphoesterase [Sedimentibacter sp. zth1]QSX04971.1 DHH family phosphoesterase [Sedimentibacter sp. zth1]